MDDVKGDFRLYTYGGYGNLEKVGSLKTDSHGTRRKHFFSSLAEIRERVTLLRGDKWFKERQLVIIQYDDVVTSLLNINSKIIEIDNPEIID